MHESLSHLSASHFLVIWSVFCALYPALGFDPLPLLLLPFILMISSQFFLIHVILSSSMIFQFNRLICFPTHVCWFTLRLNEWNKRGIRSGMTGLYVWPSTTVSLPMYCWPCCHFLVSFLCYILTHSFITLIIYRLTHVVSTSSVITQISLRSKSMTKSSTQDV